MNEIEKNIINSLNDIWDIDLQLRSWFGLGPEISSPDEMICTLFDDFSFEDWVGENRPRLSNTIQIYISDFIKDVDTLPSPLDPWIIFSSPDWERIRRKARVISSMLVSELDLS